MIAAELWLHPFIHWGSWAASEWITPPDKCFYTDILVFFLCMLLYTHLFDSVTLSGCLSLSMSPFVSPSFCLCLTVLTLYLPWLYKLWLWWMPPIAWGLCTLNPECCRKLCGIATPTQCRKYKGVRLQNI